MNEHPQPTSHDVLFKVLDETISLIPVDNEYHTLVFPQMGEIPLGESVVELGKVIFIYDKSEPLA